MRGDGRRHAGHVHALHRHLARGHDELAPATANLRALKTARDAAQMICRGDGERFTTSEGPAPTA